MTGKPAPRPVMAADAAYARARAYLAAAPRVPRGTALVSLRAEIATSPVKAAFARSFPEVSRQLCSLGPEAMPPERDTVLLLIETALMRFGLTQRADLWELLGIPPDTGRGILQPKPRRITWPVYFAMSQIAFGNALKLRNA